MKAFLDTTYTLIGIAGLSLYVLFMLHFVFPDTYHALMRWLAARVQAARDWLDGRRWSSQWNHLLDDAE